MVAGGAVPAAATRNGIGSKTRIRGGASVRAEAQVRALNRRTNGQNYEARILRKSMTRDVALDAERARVNCLRLC